MKRQSNPSRAATVAGKAQEGPRPDVPGEAHEALPTRTQGLLTYCQKRSIREVKQDRLADTEALLQELWDLSCQAEKVRVALHLMASNAGHVSQPPAGILAAVTALSVDIGDELAAYVATLKGSLGTLRANPGVTS